MVGNMDEGRVKQRSRESKGRRTYQNTLVSDTGHKGRVNFVIKLKIKKLNLAKLNYTLKSIAGKRKVTFSSFYFMNLSN